MPDTVIQYNNIQKKSEINNLNRVCVVIPSRNDEITIGSIILKIINEYSKVIVIDDNSVDRTVEIAKTAGAEVIPLHNNSGKGLAILTGLRKAYDYGFSNIILIDGDGRYKTREIPWLLSHIENNEADVIIGSRYINQSDNLPIKQQIKQKMVFQNNDNFSNFIITDPFSGFIAFNRNSLINLDFKYNEPNFPIEFIRYLLFRKLSIKETNISERTDTPLKIKWDFSLKVMAALPAYNEEQFLPSIIEKTKNYVDIVLVINDCSTDYTGPVSNRMGAHVINHQENKGYGGALQTIFSTARDLNIEALVILDSDGQHNPYDIPNVLEPLLKDFDLVIGSRFLDKTNNHVPSYRKVGMIVLDTATSIAGVKKVTDTQSGYRSYGKKAIEVIQNLGSGMSAGSEILIQSCDNNLMIKEVPINVRYDIKETSSQNPFSHGLSVLTNIISLISYRRPLLSFEIPGIIILGAGFAVGIYVFDQFVNYGVFHYVLSMFVAFFMVLGLLLMTTGLILNSLIKIMKSR